MTLSGVRRAGLAILLAIAVALSGADIAVAAQTEPDELAEYLQRASEADYGGRRIVLTTWGTMSNAEIIDVEHIHGITMISGPQTEAVIGAGKVTSAGAVGVGMESWSGPLTAERYTTSRPVPVVRLGRPARQVTVSEAGNARARLVFDHETWAPLTVEILDGDGAVYRLAAFSEFTPTPSPGAYAAMRRSGDYDLVTSGEVTGLPTDLAGYARRDTYRGPDGVGQAFYGDGLFSFSVFELADVDPETFGDGEALEFGDDTYSVRLNAADVWVWWTTDAGAYLLVGDLPPDHLEAALTELPAPETTGLLSRLWRSVFG